MSRTHRRGYAGVPPEKSTFPIVLAFGVLAALFFAPHLLGLSAFTDGDFTRHYLPYSFFQQKSLLAGQLPLWNPHVNSGHPFLADTESAVFYPVSNILLLLTWFSPTAVGRLYWLQVEALIHIILACSFTALLVHRLTGRRMAGFAAGLVFGFSGYLTGYPPLQLGILRVAVWLPLILWLLLPDKSGKTHWSRWLMACAVHAVAFFANHPQTFLFLTYTVAGWMLMLGVSQLRRRPPAGSDVQPETGVKAFDSERLLWHLGQMSTYAVFLVCLTVAQLWPALEFTSLSVRSARPFHELSSGFPPGDMWQLLLPGVMTYFSPLYVGIAGLGLALIAVAALLSNRFQLSGTCFFARPAALFFIIVGGLAILVSFGDQLPFYPLLYRFAPGWSLFRGQERVAYLVAFSLSVLSGYGLALLPALTARWRRRICWGFVVSVAGGIALVLIFWQLPGRLEASSTQFFFHAGKSLLLAAAFASLCSAPRPSRTRLILLLFVIVIDLHTTNFTTNLTEGQKIRSALTQPEIAATFQAAQTLADETTSFPPRVYNERRLPEDSGMFAGWEDVWAASVLRLSAYNTFFENFPVDRMWAVTGVGTVLTWREELPVASQLVEEFPLIDETTRLHRLESVSPRHWWTQSALRVSDRTALDLLADPGFDPQKELLIAQSDADSLGSAWEDDRMTFGSGGAASIVVERKGPAHLIFQIESDQPGLLFVSENYMPGWQALWTGMDRQSQPSKLPIVRAHQAFLGIPVPAGSGTLELAYRPASVRWGLAISGASWIILLLALRNHLAAALSQTWRRVRLLARKLRLIDFSILSRKGSLETLRNEQEDLCPSRQKLLADGQFQRVVILLAILIGFALRFFRLDTQELSIREAIAHSMSQFSFAGPVQLFNALGIPLLPGSFWLQHVWHSLTGTSEFALRSLSALLGTLAVPLVYRLAKELRLSAFATLTATILMALNSFAIFTSQEAHLNSLSLTLTIASAALALRFIGGGGSKSILVAYVLCTAATIYTQVFALLALLAQNLYVLFLLARDWRGVGSGSTLRPAGSLLLRWIVAQIAIGVLCAPWLINALSGTFEFTGYATVPSPATMLWRRFASYTFGVHVPDEIWLLDAGLFAVAITAAAVVGAIFVVRLGTDRKEENAKEESEIEQQDLSEAHEVLPWFRGHSPTVLLLLYLLVSPLAFLGPFYQKWWFYGSFHAVAWPPILLLLANGIVNIGVWVESWLGWRWRIWVDDADSNGPTVLKRIRVGGAAAASLILVIVAGNMFTLRNYHFLPEFTSSRGLRELSGLLERWSAGLSPVEVHFAQSSPDLALWNYYYQGEVGYIRLPPQPNDSEGALEAVHAFRDNGVLRVVLPNRSTGDQEATDIARQALASSYQFAGQETVGPWLVELYARPHPQQWRILGVRFANGLTLERAQVSPDFPPGGGRLVVHMEWSGDPAALTGGEKLFLHLLDESGNLVAQWDPEFRMDSSQVLTSVAMPIPPNIPVGPLRLIAGLYDVNTEGAPRILTESGEESLLLVYFQVAACDACRR